MLQKDSAVFSGESTIFGQSTNIHVEPPYKKKGEHKVGPSPNRNFGSFFLGGGLQLRLHQFCWFSQEIATHNEWGYQLNGRRWSAWVTAKVKWIRNLSPLVFLNSRNGLSAFRSWKSKMDSTTSVEHRMTTDRSESLLLSGDGDLTLCRIFESVEDESFGNSALWLRTGDGMGARKTPGCKEWEREREMDISEREGAHRVWGPSIYWVLLLGLLVFFFFAGIVVRVVVDGVIVVFGAGVLMDLIIGRIFLLSGGYLGVTTGTEFLAWPIALSGRLLMFWDTFISSF